MLDCTPCFEDELNEHLKFYNNPIQEVQKYIIDKKLQQ